MNESDDFERLLATTLDDISGCRFIGPEWTKATTLNDFLQRLWTTFLVAGLFGQHERKRRLWTTFWNDFGRFSWLQVYCSRMNESDDFERLLATTLDNFCGCRFIGPQWMKAKTLNDFWQRLWTTFLVAGLLIQNERKRRFWTTFGNDFGQVFWLQVYWSRMKESDEFERLLATTLDSVSGCRFIGPEWTKATTLNDFLQRLWTTFLVAGLLAQNERKRRFWTTFCNDLGRYSWLQVYWSRMKESDGFDRLLATTLDVAPKSKKYRWKKKTAPKSKK